MTEQEIEILLGAGGERWSSVSYRFSNGVYIHKNKLGKNFLYEGNPCDILGHHIPIIIQSVE